MGKGVSGGHQFLLNLHLNIAVLILVFFAFQSVDSKCILFNFGDSNSDTGAMTAGLGLYLGPPAGRQFFNRTTGRFCDGRLYIDFLCMCSLFLLSTECNLFPNFSTDMTIFSHARLCALIAMDFINCFIYGILVFATFFR